MTRDYDTTIARIAGNIMSGLINIYDYDMLVTPDDIEQHNMARVAVQLARAIVAEVKRTEPEAS